MIRRLGTFGGIEFTGQERDGEMVPNADFFNARYFMGVLGNFTSPDPANAGADLYHPQSWNGYAYVLGNPLGNVDPSGMWWCGPEDPSCDPDFPPPIFPPCIFFDCGGGGGGGGGGNGGSGGGTSSNTPRSTPLPPNSFPGGETLGLPPGMRVPLPSPAVLLGLNLNLNCEFGVCVGGVGNSLAPNPGVGTAIGNVVRSTIGVALGPVALAVELIVFDPSSAGGTSEIKFENANNDFYQRRRAVRAFYSEHLSQTEIKDCDQEWQDAIEACTEELAQPNYKIKKKMFGTSKDVFDCARGRVPKRCGGLF